MDCFADTQKILLVQWKDGVKMIKKQCTHSKCTPSFDEERAKNISAQEVRKTYPRFDGTCPDCNTMVICYASWSHYIKGDW